jgi:hypothetical protein
MFPVNMGRMMAFVDFELDRLVDEWHGPNGFTVKNDSSMSGFACRHCLHYEGNQLGQEPDSAGSRSSRSHVPQRHNCNIHTA